MLLLLRLCKLPCVNTIIVDHRLDGVKRILAIAFAVTILLNSWSSRCNMKLYYSTKTIDRCGLAGVTLLDSYLFIGKVRNR